MQKTRKLVIVGEGEFGEIAYEYFTHDSEYEVVAFAVESIYRTKDSLYDLPIVNLEDLKDVYPPTNHVVYVAITHTKLNRVRLRLFDLCKKMGYTCASYISSKAFVWRNVSVGENVFVFEHTTIQHHAQIGNNVVIWNGTDIAHRTVVGDNCWIAANVTFSGFCNIGAGCFIGSSACLGDNVTIANDVLLGAGTVVVKNLLDKGGVYVGNPAKKLEGRTSYQQFKVEEDEIG